MSTVPLSQYDYFDPRILSEPYDFYRRLRAEAPVYKVHHAELDKDIYLVTSYALVQEVGANPGLYSSEFAHVLFGGGSLNQEADRILEAVPCEPTMLLTTDDPIHKRRRALVSSAFTPRTIARMTESIAQLTDELIDNFIERGECDFVRDFAIHLPTYVIADILGVPRKYYDRVTEWSDAVILRVGKMATRDEEIAAAHRIVEFRQFILSIIKQRRTAPGDDLISLVMGAEAIAESPLTDPEVLAFVQEVLVAGNETTRNTLIGGLARLIRHPEQLSLLRDHPELTGNAVDEILRLETPASAMWRIATQETTLGGVRLPQGAVLSLRYDSANRDEGQFPNADDFDVRRTNARTHLAFSYGTHHCMGQNLARKELAIALPRIVSRLQNLKIVPERSDLSYRPNVMIRALRGLYITFDPGPRVRQDHQPQADVA
jgi:cytochrome P450